tara:strand:+ start:298 stop:513 length:216 start_codon:yes stop_codon:yes gene_type:complete
MFALKKDANNTKKQICNIYCSEKSKVNPFRKKASALGNYKKLKNSLQENGISIDWTSNDSIGQQLNCECSS